MNLPATSATPGAAAPRTVVVVLGPGRSGTSLLMQVLAALGLTPSGELIPAGHHNPRGHFEDAAIVRIQADLLRALGAWPYHPLPAGWLHHPASARAAAALADLLRARLAQHPGRWGFKDPRTASLLPLWQGVFSRAGITPRYLLALRQPGKVMQSFMRAYQTPAREAEAVWLRRTCDALWHTRADCHIVHYEDWFSQPRQVAQALARDTGLAAASAADIAAHIVQRALDRCGAAPPAPCMPQTRTLYAALRACQGRPHDPAGLLDLVRDCRADPASDGTAHPLMNCKLFPLSLRAPD